jgi:outer membrane lipoprotein-sorting protein
MKAVVQPVVMVLTGLGLLVMSALYTWAQDAPKTIEPSLTTTEVVTHIQAKAKDLRSLTGQFRQVKFTRLLTAPIESQGTFQWQPPQNFCWEVTEPVPFRLVAKGDTILIHYPDLKRADRYHHPMGGGLLGQITGAAGDAEAFERSYNLQVLPAKAGASEPDALIPFRMEPRSSQQSRYLKHIEVLIDPVVWLPQKIVIWESNDDRTTIFLSNLVENDPLPETVFSVEPPAGVELRQLQGGKRP